MVIQIGEIDMAKMQKGVAGNKTGAKARKAIKDAEKAGLTQAEIAKSAKRSIATIRNIKSGDIKNPPAYVEKDIKKATSRAKRKSK